MTVFFIVFASKDTNGTLRNQTKLRLPKNLGTVAPLYFAQLNPTCFFKIKKSI